MIKECNRSADVCELSTIAGGETRVPAKVLRWVTPRKPWPSENTSVWVGSPAEESTNSNKEHERLHQASTAARRRMAKRDAAAHQRAAMCARPDNDVCVCVCVPARKRALEGQDSEQTSAPPLLAQVSWARGAGFPLGRHFTASEEQTESHHHDNHLDTHTHTPHRSGAYRRSPSCSSAVSVQADTHTRSLPGCSHSRARSSHCWCCTHQRLRHNQRERETQSVFSFLNVLCVVFPAPLCFSTHWRL